MSKKKEAKSNVQDTLNNPTSVTGLSDVVSQLCSACLTYSNLAVLIRVIEDALTKEGRGPDVFKDYTEISSTCAEILEKYLERVTNVSKALADVKSSLLTSLHVSITFAVTPSSLMLSSVYNSIRSFVHTPFVLVPNVDSSILGGFSVEYNGRVLDLTLAPKFKSYIKAYVDKL